MSNLNQKYGLSVKILKRNIIVKTPSITRRLVSDRGSFCAFIILALIYCALCNRLVFPGGDHFQKNKTKHLFV